MSTVFRPYASGRVFIGTATADGAFTLVDENGVSIAAIGPRQRVVIYAASSDGDAEIGYSTTYLLAINAQAVSLPWGLPLPIGQAPTTDVGIVTTVTILGEILD